MKIIFKKITSFFLLALLLTTAISAQQASARTTSSTTSWGISFTTVATGTPYYSTYQALNPTTAYSGSTYNLTSNCAIVGFKYTTGCSTWVWVDGVNFSNYKLIDFQSSGSYYYSTVAIPNLTPGTHSIQVRASSPDYMSTAIKSSTLYVVIPNTTTSSTAKVK